MNLDKTNPEIYFEEIKKQNDFPHNYIEEIFLVAKLSANESIIKETTTLLDKIADKDVFAAFKNRSKFDLTPGFKARKKNLTILFKMAAKCKSLKYGKMYHILEDDDRLFINEDFKFDSLPEEIGCFEGAKFIHLSINNIETLPDSIGDIKSLEKLEISSFKLKEIPRGIANLKNLKILDISASKLTEIPDFINECESLEEIEIHGYMSSGFANYEKLPVLSGLKHLKRIRISTIRIERINENFFELPDLEELELVNIQNLKEIPASLKNLKSLNKLTIANCPQLEKVPSEIADLSVLSSLVIGSMPLVKEIDGRIIFKDTLEELQISSFEAEMDMSGIGDSKIKQFQVRDKKIFSQLLSHAEKFSKLEKLSILECKDLDSIPDSIGQFSALKELKIEPAGIKSLPETIGNLSNLEELIIRSQLETFPAGFSKLKKLKKLNIGSINLEFSFESLPGTIEELSIGAKTIDLKRDNPIKIKNLILSTKNILNPEYISSIKETEKLQILDCKGLTFKLISLSDTVKDLKLHYYPEEISEDILNLQQLESLELYFEKDKEASTISEQTGNLPKLKNIKISNWNGSDISQIIGGSAPLESVYVYNIKQLNDAAGFSLLIDNLRKKNTLKSLYFDNVEITNEQLEEITQLKQLESLTVNFVKFNLLPKSLLEMKKLTTLSLKYTYLEALPDWIGEMKQLETLEIESPRAFNAFETLPASLADLPKLKRLSIYDLYPKEVPEELNKLQLEELKIHNMRGRIIRKAVLDILACKKTRFLNHRSL